MKTRANIELSNLLHPPMTYREGTQPSLCFKVPHTFFFKFWFVRLLALRPLLAYCASQGWYWRWLWRSRWNVDWLGKPKFSEKTCPSATFVHHKIPHDQTRVWTRVAAVGSRQLTAWAMARPFHILTYGAWPFLRSSQLCSYSRTARFYTIENPIF
jgi:hypothetical protein